MMQGRRYSEGLHQALEAKEHVQVQPENQTLASITFQNYFRMYEKLAGMTGTALTEADELFDIYKLEVVEIPTNVPVAPSRRGRRGLSHPEREIRRDPGRDRARQCAAAAGAGRHRLDREVRSARRIPEEARLQADRFRQRKRDGEALRRGARRQAGQAVRGAERALPRAGSLYRRRSRRARRDHDRDQHGRPRHRHQARRLARNADPAGDRRDYRRGREGREDRADQGRHRAFPRHRAEGGGHRRDRARQGIEAGEDRDPAGRPLHHGLRTP